MSVSAVSFHPALETDVWVDGKVGWIVAWTAKYERVVGTHDRGTMPYHTNPDRKAEKIAGIVIVSKQLPFSQVINDLEIIVSCSDMVEFSGDMLQSVTVFRE